MAQSRAADGRILLESARRNREPILEVLRQVLPSSGQILELASGTGQHAWYFAKHLPSITWQPSEADDGAFASILAWRAHERVDNLLEPIRIDVTAEDWSVDQIGGTFCSNLFHIAPWEVTVGLMRGVGRILPPGAPLVTYGAYRIGGEHTAPSNESFDASLRGRNPAWGVRDLEAVADQAAAAGLSLEQTIAMPNNNHTLVFRRVD